MAGNFLAEVLDVEIDGFGGFKAWSQPSGPDISRPQKNKLIGFLRTELTRNASFRAPAQGEGFTRG
jgi:hypothetical protein